MNGDWRVSMHSGQEGGRLGVKSLLNLTSHCFLTGWAGHLVFHKVLKTNWTDELYNLIFISSSLVAYSIIVPIYIPHVYIFTPLLSP